jgi:hypothetical protein
MITDKIKKQIIEAMKAKDEIRLSTFKLLSSALYNAQIKKREELSEEEELEIVKQEAKKRKDAIEVYEKAGATERAEKEKKELKILQEYLPEELSDEELKKIVDEVVSSMGATNMQDMGKAIGAVLGKCKGQADGKKVSEMVRSKLS